jgi:hypothetical protein
LHLEGIEGEVVAGEERGPVTAHGTSVPGPLPRGRIAGQVAQVA